MAGPSWVAGPLALVMIGTAAYCVSRLAAAWRWRRPAEYDVDGVHAFMGVAMAGMLVPRLNPLGAGGWEVIFGVAAAWFGGQAIREYLRQRSGRHRAGHRVQHPHYLHHLLASGAMLYMLGYAAGAPGVPMAGPAMAGMPGAAAGLPSLTLGLALALFAGVIWAVDRLLARPAPAAGRVAGNPAAQAGTTMSPRLAACCEIVMGLTMGYMLITML